MENNYPCIKKCTDGTKHADHLIVLFTSRDCGIVLISDYYEYLSYHTNWGEEYFINYEEDFILPISGGYPKLMVWCNPKGKISTTYNEIALFLSSKTAVRLRTKSGSFECYSNTIVSCEEKKETSFHWEPYEDVY